MHNLRDCPFCPEKTASGEVLGQSFFFAVVCLFHLAETVGFNEWDAYWSTNACLT